MPKPCSIVVADGKRWLTLCHFTGGDTIDAEIAMLRQALPYARHLEEFYADDFASAIIAALRRPDGGTSQQITIVGFERSLGESMQHVLKAKDSWWFHIHSWTRPQRSTWFVRNTDRLYVDAYAGTQRRADAPLRRRILWPLRKPAAVCPPTTTLRERRIELG